MIFHWSVKSRATEDEAESRWMDARHQIDCLTKHASRKSEEVLQRSTRHSGGSRQRMPETREEKGKQGFVRKRVSAEYAEATSLLRNVSTEVRTNVSFAFSVTHNHCD